MQVIGKTGPGWHPGTVLSTLLLLLVFVQPANATTSADDSPVLVFSMGHARIMDHATFWTTQNPVNHAELISGKYDPSFIPVERSQLFQGADNWIRIRIHNSSDSEGRWVLDLEQVMVSDTELISLDQDGHLHLQRTGLKYSYSSRPLPHNHFAFPITQPPNSTHVYYLKVNTPFQLHFNPSLSDHVSFMKNHQVNFASSHLFIGLLFGVLLYLIVLSFGTPDNKPLWHFVSFVTFAILLTLYSNGFLMPLLPTGEWFSTRLWLILELCLQGSTINVIKSYFHTADKYPRIHSYLLICLVITGLLFLLLPFVSYTTLVQLELMFVAQFIIVLTSISIYVWYREKTQVMLFAIGNIGLTLSGALSTFAALGFITSNDWLIVHGYEIGFCWQAVFFTWAISKKINTLATSALLAEAESKAKNEFIAKMSHEIRTPMNGVLGMVQLLKNTPVNEEQKHYLDVIDSSGKTLLTVINDILDYSRLIAGKVELKEEPFELNKLLAELNTLFTDIAHEKKLSFTIIVADDVPNTLIGDSIRIYQILTNLLANSFKFTETGLVTLKVRTVPSLSSEMGTASLQFIVKDTGIGISTADQKHLFQSFMQVHLEDARRYGGSGLGLSICKQLAEIMDGNIEVTSTPGEGSEFVATLNLHTV